MNLRHVSTCLRNGGASVPSLTVPPRQQRKTYAVSEKIESGSDRPDWTGDTVISKAVNLAIETPLIFNLLKLGARQQMKATAENSDIAWSSCVKALESDLSRLQRLFEEVEDKEVEYPDYFTKPFHGYDEGNMNWLAAFEAEPATYSMAMRVWKDEVGLQPVVAQDRLRDTAFDMVKGYMEECDCRDIERILDIGCSVGVSTTYVARSWPKASVVGMDLSPYMLSVALLRKQQGGALFGLQHEKENVTYVHGNAEHTKFDSESFDAVSCQFLLHELPPEPTRAIAEECMRILRPGGTCFFLDNNPKSAVIQNLPAPLFTLMKSTEPHSDEYYAFDTEACLRQAGFEHVRTLESDPRHRLILATKKK
ncbi:hypothetical protein M9435_000028 [Picochlorum sp. BPE23]|nr:hypothetical protein M9435_000028 [Picochlorum sp. BPE23]